MSENSIKSSTEALIFASGDPVETDRICEVLGIKAEQVASAVNELNKGYEKSESALRIIKLNDSYQLVTESKYAPEIRKMLEIQRNTPLSPAAFEVLAVIAYNQPVTRAFIEQVRGVDCSGVVSSLVEKGLIEERGRLELPGRPLIYGTTDSFLRCFGIESLDELPELPKKTAEEQEMLTGEDDGQVEIDEIISQPRSNNTEAATEEQTI